MATNPYTELARAFTRRDFPQVIKLLDHSGIDVDHILPGNSLRPMWHHRIQVHDYEEANYKQYNRIWEKMLSRTKTLLDPDPAIPGKPFASIAWSLHNAEAGAMILLSAIPAGYRIHLAGEDPEKVTKIHRHVRTHLEKPDNELAYEALKSMTDEARKFWLVPLTLKNAKQIIGKTFADAAPPRIALTNEAKLLNQTMREAGKRIKKALRSDSPARVRKAKSAIKDAQAVLKEVQRLVGSNQFTKKRPGDNKP